jgi:lipopolysaccharide export system permease protein
MKIIDRYVGFSVLLTAIFGVLVLSLVLVLGNIFKELLNILVNNPDVPILGVLYFMALVLPFSLTFTIPWGFLTAILLVFGRMSADSEFVALKANGIGILRASASVFTLGAVLSGLCFWINSEIAPRAEQAMKNALIDIATTNPAALFRADEVVDAFPDRRVYVGGKDGDRLLNITVFELGPDGRVRKMVHAREGSIKPDIENSRLLLHLYDAQFEQRDEKNPGDLTKIQQGISVQEGVFPLSLDRFFQRFKSERRLTAYSLSELFHHLGESTGKRHLETLVEFNRRFSASLSCLAFALVAVPLGITTHRKETSVGFAISLIVAFGYFFFIIIANTFRTEPNAWPQLLIWAPNVIFFSLGAWLLRRLAKS